MSVVEDRELEIDSASILGVTLLGQLTRHLREALHVLDFVTGQVDLNLGEVTSAVAQAEYEANRAFEAANLLMRGAALDESWSRDASRPKAIFARHHAAVAAGALRMEPARAPMVIGSRPCPISQEKLPPKPPNATRPRCGHPTKTTGKSCANRVVVLENGILASGCSTHLPDAERPSYERQKAQTEAWMNAALEHQQSHQAHLMADATALWLRRQARELGMAWDDFHDMLELDREPVVEDQHAMSEVDGWSACDSCAPYVVNTVALASVGMEFLHGWAARQQPPRWADRSLPPGDWLLEVPPSAPAHRDELGLHLAASVFAEIATPTDDIATVVGVRQREFIDGMLEHIGQAGLLCDPDDRVDDPPAAKPTVAPPRPGARPTIGKRPKKKHRKR